MPIKEHVVRLLKKIWTFLMYPNDSGLYLGIIVLFLDYLFEHNIWKTQNNGSIHLAIGILSARDNFDQRAVARSTWLQNLLSENDYKTWFIVGNSSCDIPPEYRLSVYGCEKWNIRIPDLKENFMTSFSESGKCISPQNYFYQGFTFQVNYPVVISKLGIHSSLLMENTPTKVALMDIQSKEIVVQSIVFVNESNSEKGYVFADVDPILLPKNYEGLILVEGYLKEQACFRTVWDDGGGAITFKRIYLTTNHLDSKKFSSNFSVATSIGFFIPDLENLTKIAKNEKEVTKTWLHHLKVSNKKLQAEVHREKDIIIVNVTDTYRSLPLKLLKFYQWLDLNYNYTHVLKTDDDCIINVKSLLKPLEEDHNLNSSKPWVWSRFRKGWPVNYIGKWADYEYSSSTYPAFPCGAAYVMSHPLVKWLSSNAEYLHPYQGEDVSLGIWISAINPEIIEDVNFECDASCKKASYNRAQLNDSQLHMAWNSLNSCNSLCNCKT